MYEMASEKWRGNRWNEILAKVLFAASLIFGIAAMVAATNHIVEDAPAKYHKLALGLMVLSWVTGQLLYIKAANSVIVRQLLSVDVIVAVIFGMLAIIGRNALRASGHEEFALSFLVLCVGGLLPFVYAAWIKRENKGKHSIKEVQCWALRHKLLILTEAIVLILIVTQAGATLRWDAQYIAKAQVGVQLSDVFNLSKMSFYGHIDMSYAAFTAVMAAFMAGSMSKGAVAATVILILCSVAAMYGIIKAYVPNRLDFEYALLALCWGVSPFVLGVSGDYIYDLYAIWFLPVVVYFAVTDQWMLHLMAALFLVFIKEPAIVAYAGFALGVLLTDLLIKKKPIQKVITRGRYWGMLLVGLTWFYVYTILPNCWGGEGMTYFSVDIPYVIEKCKVLYVLNFNWILTILSIGAIVAAIVKKNAFPHSILPLVMCDLFFVVFSCLFVTVNHARYIDTHIAVLNILAFLGIETLACTQMRYGLTGVTAVLMIVSNYYTIDPFTKSVFQTYQVGNTTMVATCDNECMSDSMVYNRQWESFDKLLDRALEDIVDGDNQIFYPKLGWNWFVVGDGRDDVVMELNYDLKEKKHVWFENGNCIPYIVYNADSMDTIRENLGEGTAYYIYFPFVGAELADEIRAEELVLEEEEFRSLGVTAIRIKFERQK